MSPATEISDDLPANGPEKLLRNAGSHWGIEASSGSVDV